MMIGYLPDSFGQSARMPQILNGFDIRRVMFWRGTSERMGSDKTEFIWKGEDGAALTAQLLPLGYAIGKYLPTDHKALRARLDKYLPVLDKGATTDHILLPNGHDQMPIQKNIFEVMRAIEECYPGRTTRLGRYEEVFDEVEKNPALDTLTGEFLDGKYMRVHRSIYSSRADLKSANTRIENKITNTLEPLAAMAYSLGFDYHHGLIEAIWKELMKNHAHDSIGCCCSDKVHRAIADRFFLAEERADCLIEHCKRKIVDAMPCDRALDKLTVFNTLPYPRTEVVTAQVITKMKAFALTDADGHAADFEVLDKEVVDAGLIDRQIVHYGDYDPFVRYTLALRDTFPAMGYKTYLITPADALPAPAPRSDAPAAMENEFLAVDIAPNGTLTLTDKVSGQVYKDVLLLEDGSDDGDGYDYSPLAEDFVVTSKDLTADIRVEHRARFSRARIALTLPVPADLDERRARMCGASVDVEFTLTLRENSPLLELDVTCDNRARDHRLRLLVPTGAPADTSYSDNQFGSIARPAVDPAMQVWKAEHWSERPDAIYPFLSYVSAHKDRGLGVVTNSVREYELTGPGCGTIAVTLFRCVGVLGKEELFRRPGRPSGIRMQTPDSQMPGRHTYALALTADVARLPRRAKEYTAPLVSYNKMPYNAMKLNPSALTTPYEYSLLQTDDADISFSALKKEEQGDGLLLRCYNATAAPRTTALTTPWRPDGECRLDETPTGGAWDPAAVTFAPNQTRTLRLRRP